MLCQLPLEGILNQSIFAFESDEDEQFFGVASIPAKYLFLVSSGISLLFIANSTVAFINVNHDNALGVKEKLVLILIHLIRIAVSLASSSTIILIKSDLFSFLGYIMWLLIMFLKALVLSVCMMKNQDNWRLD